MFSVVPVCSQRGGYVLTITHDPFDVLVHSPPPSSPRSLQTFDLPLQPCQWCWHLVAIEARTVSAYPTGSYLIVSHLKSLPAATKLWPRKYFYTCLSFCSRGGTWSADTPPGADTTPKEQTPPGPDTPPGTDSAQSRHLPQTRHPPPGPDTPWNQSPPGLSTPPRTKYTLGTKYTPRD